MKREWRRMYRAMRTGRTCQTAAGDYRYWRARDFYQDRPEGVTPERWREVCDTAEEEADCANAGHGGRQFYRATYLQAAGRVLTRYGKWYSVADYLGAPERWVKIRAGDGGEAALAASLQRMQAAFGNERR